MQQILIIPTCDQFKEQHLIRGPLHSHGSTYNSWDGRCKGASAAAALHINFQLMGSVALVQRYLLPRRYDCQGHIWWKHDEAAVYLSTPPAPSCSLSTSALSVSLPAFLSRSPLAQSYWTVGDCWVLITRRSMELIEHSTGLISLYSKSRCWLCKFCPVPLGEWGLLPDTKVIFFPLAPSCCLCNLPEGLFMSNSLKRYLIYPLMISSRAKLRPHIYI